MRQGIKGARIMAALAVFWAMNAGGVDASAALTGITITGGFQPATGDPPYDYIFEVYLAPGATVNKNESIKIGTATSGFEDDLVGVTPKSYDREDPSGHWGTPTIAIVDEKFPYASDVTWTYIGPTYTNKTGKEKHIGELEVETVVNFNSKNPFPLSSGTPIDYTYTLNGVTVNGGTILLRNLAVPEPSASVIVLLAGGTAAVSALVVRTRRRRPDRTT